MLYKICDFYVKMSPIYDYTRSMAEKFIYNGIVPIDAVCIYLTEYSVSELNNYKLTEYYSKLPLYEIEFILLADEFHSKIPQYNAIMLHSSAVKYKEKCYLFSAPSGFGKSTHTMLWEKLFNAEIINDDSPVLKILDDNKIMVYGTPFAGGTKKALNDSAQLAAVIFLERSHQNSIIELSTRKAISRFLMGTRKFSDISKMNLLLEILNTICSRTKFYLLLCNTNDDSAVIAKKLIIKDDLDEN